MNERYRCCGCSRERSWGSLASHHGMHTTRSCTFDLSVKRTGKLEALLRALLSVVYSLAAALLLLSPL